MDELLFLMYGLIPCEYFSLFRLPSGIEDSSSRDLFTLIAPGIWLLGKNDFELYGRCLFFSKDNDQK